MIYLHWYNDMVKNGIERMRMIA